MYRVMHSSSSMYTLPFTGQGGAARTIPRVMLPNNNNSQPHQHHSFLVQPQGIVSMVTGGYVPAQHHHHHPGISSSSMQMPQAIIPPPPAMRSMSVPAAASLATAGYPMFRPGGIQQHAAFHSTDQMMAAAQQTVGFNPQPAVRNEEQLNLAYQTASLLFQLQQQAANIMAPPRPNVPTTTMTTESPRPRVTSVGSSSESGVQMMTKKMRESEDEPKDLARTQSASSSLVSDVDDSSDDHANGGNGNGFNLKSPRGERRLVIAFSNLGSRGKFPQTFGKSRALIPDGVVGTHTVYNERWRFEIIHGSDAFHVNKQWCVCILWRITNLNTGTVTEVTETKEEAIVRNSQGQTITNRVFREALEARAKEIEKRLDMETSSKSITQLKAMLANLRPKRFSEGPLVFGLQHKVVQDRMIADTD